MTGKSFRRQIVLTIVALLIAAFSTIYAAHRYDPSASELGRYVSAIMPIYIAIAGAWLGSCLQRRIAYTNALRAFWERLVEAVQDAISYTHLVKSDEAKFNAALNLLSRRIEEMRSIFRNVGETYRPPSTEQKSLVSRIKDTHHLSELPQIVQAYRRNAVRNVGFYPYESLKQIHDVFMRLGRANVFNAEENRAAVRDTIDVLWKILRAELLKELERDYPEFPDTPYATTAKRKYL